MISTMDQKSEGFVHNKISTFNMYMVNSFERLSNPIFSPPYKGSIQKPLMVLLLETKH